MVDFGGGRVEVQPSCEQGSRGCLATDGQLLFSFPAIQIKLTVPDMEGWQQLALIFMRQQYVALKRAPAAVLWQSSSILVTILSVG